MVNLSRTEHNALEGKEMSTRANMEQFYNESKNKAGK